MELKVPLTESLKDLLLRCFELKEDERPHDFTLIDTALQKIYRAETGTPYPRPSIQAATNTADSLNNRALSFFDIGRPEEAEKCWEEALKKDANHADSLYNRSLYLWRNAKIDDLEALRLVESNSTHAYYHLALLHIARSDAEQAIECLNQARELEGETERITKALATAQQMTEEERDGRRLLIFEKSSQDARSICLSPDGQRALSGSSHGEVRLWDIATGKCIRIFWGHRGTNMAVSFSPDGQMAISSATDNTFRLWNVIIGKCVQTIQDSEPFSALCFSPDGQKVISGSEKGEVKLWHLEAGEYRTFEGRAGSVKSFVFSPDGQKVLSAGVNGSNMKLWDVATGKCIRTSEGYFACLSPDGQKVLSISKCLKLWDVTKGKTFCFSPDGQKALSGGYGYAKIWNITTGVCICSLHTGNESAFFSPDGRTVLSGEGDAPMKLYRLPQEGTTEMLLSRIHSTETTAKRRELFLSLADKTKMLTGKKDIAGALDNLEKLRAERLFGNSLTFSALAGKIAGYCVRGNTLISQTRQVIETGKKWIESVCFSPDNRFVLSGNREHTAEIWDTATGECIRTFKNAGWIHSVCFSPDGQWMLSGGFDKDNLRLWDTATGECIRIFEGHTKSVESVCFSPDGQWVLSGSYDKTLRLWDTATGECIRIFEGHTKSVESVCFSPDGQWVLSGSVDQSTRLWDTATGECIRTFNGHTYSVTSVCFSPDGQWVLSGSYDKTLRLWDTATGECIRTFNGHTSSVNSICFSPDGQWVVSGSWDNSFRLWNIATGECIRTWKEKDRIDSVCFSSDGTRIVAAVMNEIHIYHLEFDLHFPGWADWDEGAQPYLDIFRKVHPNYTEKDIQGFLTELQYRGYGWLRPEGVRKRLASR
jgi:WD40 repeat protein